MLAISNLSARTCVTPVSQEEWSTTTSDKTLLSPCMWTIAKAYGSPESILALGEDLNKEDECL